MLRGLCFTVAPFFIRWKMELTSISHVGPKTEKLFQKLGVTDCESLRMYYPIHYDEYLPPVAAKAAVPGSKCAVTGHIARAVVVRQVRNMKIAVTEISDPTGKIRLTWYNAPFMRTVLKRGAVYIFRGNVGIRGGTRVMEHPEIYTPEQYDEKLRTLSPVYALTKGLSNNMVIKAVQGAFDLLPPVREYLPEQIVKLLGLMDETEAARFIHFPRTEEELNKARKRLAFDEFFLFILAMRKLKDSEEVLTNEFPMKETWDTEELIDALPYRLTRAQEDAWHEIEADLKGKKLMSRLLQGDVGSGKTILAFLAMEMAASNGYQSALMAPTEVLARQHFEKLRKLAGERKIRNLTPVLLTGSMKAAEKREALFSIASGEANAIIGTHALIQDSVKYKALALVITDEQHRFGVCQRKALSEKGSPPNMMVMSATPIPRTLGVIYYGDMDVSIIDELPKERLPVKNCVVDPSYRPKAFDFIAKQIGGGRQAYIICPMIEESEGLEAENVLDYTKKIRRQLPDVRVGMLHGRMKAREKDEIMEAFASGDIQLLVSTTVIEVGVDVPNATVMMIENAERFGLATLHQLRGRVGRGSFQSYCIFMAGQESEDIKKRLDILKESHSGFEIAEKDFEMRGPGDLLGIRQSGDAMFKIADIARDGDVLKTAGETTAAIMEEDPGLIDEEHELLKKKLEEYIASNERSIVL